MQFPAFLHNLTHWLLSQDEGVVKGTIDTKKVEDNPVVQAALSAAENAGKSVLMAHVGQALGVEPSAAGIATALVDIVDNAPQVPTDAKAPLKMILGGILAGSDFLAPAAASASTVAEKPAGSPQSASGVEVPAAEDKPAEDKPAGTETQVAGDPTHNAAISSYKES